MSMQSWNETIVCSYTDGPTLTAAARASCIPVAAKTTLPNNFWYPGRAMKVRMGGRISCAVTTPGTGRFDICLGAAGTTIVYDTAAFNLNTAGKTNVPWYFEVTLVCRAIGTGTGTTFFPMGGAFTSEALVGSALPTVGGNGTLLLPVGAPAVGAGTDVTTAHVIDCFWTPSLSTASLQCHQLQIDIAN